jgi:membrane protein involved in colicin uptake
VGNSSGHDILDRAAIDVVKDWKLASSDSEQQGISQSFTFAKKGSDTESLARERREKQERDRLVREKEQQEKERLARQQQEQERQAREQQQQEQELRDRAPVTTPEPLVTPSTPIEPLPTTTPSSPIEPSPVPFESLTPSLPPE